LASGILSGRSISALTLLAIANGASIVPFFQYAFDFEGRKLLNKVATGWTYPAFFAVSQLYLNLAPSNARSLFRVPFMEALGIVFFKDLLYNLTLPKSELYFCEKPPKKEALLKMLNFSTRDYSPKVKIWMLCQAITLVALTALNFTLREEIAKLGGQGGEELDKEGFYQDALAAFIGMIAGNGVSRILDDWKLKKEKKYFNRIAGLRSLPASLKVARMGKIAIRIFSPYIMGVLLSLQTPPNSLGSFFCVGGTFALDKMDCVWRRRDFENPDSQFHQARKTEKKVEKVFCDYLPSLIALGGFIAFMSTVAATSDDVGSVLAAAGFIISLLASFALTDRVANSPHNQESRFRNELDYRLLCPGTTLSVFYQYLTSKMDLSDKNIKPDSMTLLILIVSAWCLLGTIMGNSRARYMQNYLDYELSTLPLAIQEWMNAAVSNFRT
jgi:hypothetical protein